MRLDWSARLGPAIAEFVNAGSGAVRMCTACGVRASWVDPNGWECARCYLRSATEWEVRGGFTSEWVAELIGAVPGRHRRVVADAVGQWWVMQYRALGVEW